MPNDISILLSRYKELNLQSIGSNQYGPPKNVVAVRDGNKVTITWSQVEMTKDKDRGYLLELFVCQDGAYLWWTDSYPDQFTTSYTVRDEKGCGQASSGKLYTVEKHGFSDPAIINWPKRRRPAVCHNGAFRLVVQNDMVREHVQKVEHMIEKIVEETVHADLFFHSEVLTTRLKSALGIDKNGADKEDLD